MSHHREHLKKSVALYAAVMDSTDPGEERQQRVDEIIGSLYHGEGTSHALAFIERLEERNIPALDGVAGHVLDGVEAHFSLIRHLAKAGHLAAARYEAERYERWPIVARRPRTHPVFGYIEVALATEDGQPHFALTQALKMQEWEVGNRVDAFVQIATKLNHPEALDKALEAARRFEEKGESLAASEAYRLIALGTRRAEHWTSALLLAQQLDRLVRDERLSVIVKNIRAQCVPELVEAILRALPEGNDGQILLRDQDSG